MKKKMFLPVMAVVAVRICVLFCLRDDPVFFLSPRNFNGRGLLTVPSWADFLLMGLILVWLWPGREELSVRGKELFRALLRAGAVVMAPAVTALLLSPYTERFDLFLQPEKEVFLRMMLVPLTFWAGNLLADRRAWRRRGLRLLGAGILLLLLAGLQDLAPATGGMYMLLGFFSSPGMTTFWLVLALRPVYRRQPAAAVAAVLLAAPLFTLLVFSGISASVFTLFLPSLALAMMAWSLYLRRRVWRWTAAALPLTAAVILGGVVPVTASPEKREQLLVLQKRTDLHEVRVGGVTVRYGDERLRPLAVRLGRVIDAANRLSREEFGISPEVNELVLYGYGSGGFHAEYPGRIVGRIISPVYRQHCLDPAFLADTALSLSFPDPVNGLLHEYSHLYGSVPYFRWLPGPEEEGWATFSATVLSQMLHEQYGDSLWDPPYDYARLARRITRRNLSGKAVVWSHPYEYGGFRLWYHLAQELGLKTLYRKRWENTRRDLNVSVMLISKPSYARKMIRALGEERFRSYGEGTPVIFGERYPLKEYVAMARLTGMDTVHIGRMYRMAKERTVDPRIILAATRVVYNAL